MSEREVKLAAPAGFELPELAGPDDGFLAEARPDRRYTTVYWDTPDLRLARWGAQLRHRGDEGWTVKLPGELDGSLMVRDEHQFQGTARRVPPEALALLRQYVRGAEIAPVARTRTVRRPVVLKDAAGNQLAEVVDDRVQLLDGRHVVGGYRELEVELAGDTQPAAVDKLLDRLRQAGASETTGQDSKYRRALGDRDVAEHELAVPEPGRNATLEHLVRADLAASASRLLQHLPVVLLGEDPEGVHQARVGIRRLRSTLRTVRGELDGDWTRALRDELKWLAGLLGAVRDADVLLARLEEQVGALPEVDRPGARRLLERLAAEREDARERLLDALGEERVAALLDRVVAAAQAPPFTGDASAPAADVLPPLVAKDLRKLRKAIRKAGKHPEDDQLHRIRIKAKRVRYASEAAAPVAGKPAESLAAAAEGIQDVLGDQHDAVVAEDWLRRSITGLRRDALLPAGELVAAERAAAAEGRATWRAAAKKLKGSKRTGWL